MRSTESHERAAGSGESTLAQASKSRRHSRTASGASWFRGAHTRREALLEAGGVEKDVGLLETDEGNDAVDAD
jgi:hypothetical protein